MEVQIMGMEYIIIKQIYGLALLQIPLTYTLEVYVYMLVKPLVDI